MGRYLDMVAKLTPMSVITGTGCEKSERSEKSPWSCSARLRNLRDSPVEWLDGLTRLRAMPCPAGVSLTDWRSIVMAAGSILSGWGPQLAGLGWHTLDIFGCHPEAPLARLDCAGLAIIATGKEIVAVTESAVTLRTMSGALQSFRQQSTDTKVCALWQLLCSDSGPVQSPDAERG